MEILPRKRSKAEAGFIRCWLRRPLAHRSLASIRGKDIAEFIREHQAGGAGPNTIRLDLALLSHLYTVARSARGMESLSNPVALVKGSRPKLPRGRDRRLSPVACRLSPVACRLSPDEEPRLIAACEACGGPIAAIVVPALGGRHAARRTRRDALEKLPARKAVFAPYRFEETVEIVARKRLDFPAVPRPNEILDAFDLPAPLLLRNRGVY